MCQLRIFVEANQYITILYIGGFKLKIIPNENICNNNNIYYYHTKPEVFFVKSLEKFCWMYYC